jgi:hypothetical protein
MKGVGTMLSLAQIENIRLQMTISFPEVTVEVRKDHNLICIHCDDSKVIPRLSRQLVYLLTGTGYNASNYCVFPNLLSQSRKVTYRLTKTPQGQKSK